MRLASETADSYWTRDRIESQTGQSGSALEIGERQYWKLVMAAIDICTIQKFVPRAWQIYQLHFNDKELCPVGAVSCPRWKRN